jgi:hypothetical protein
MVQLLYQGLLVISLDILGVQGAQPEICEAQRFTLLLGQVPHGALQRPGDPDQVGSVTAAGVTLHGRQSGTRFGV